jgi:hypothetical protein
MTQKEEKRVLVSRALGFRLAWLVLRSPWNRIGEGGRGLPATHAQVKVKTRPEREALTDMSRMVCSKREEAVDLTVDLTV